MKFFRGSNTQYYIGFSIFFIFLVITRFWNLHIFPAALTHDEIVYAVQAKSFAVQGSTLNQLFRPWQLQPAHPMYAEAPAVLLAPFFKIFENPLLATRVLSALIGISMPFALAWFSYGIWKNKQLSSFVLVIAGINPLLWQLSRLTYDAVLSVFFYLIAGAILLNTQGKKTILALPFLTLGFFCYQGYKLVFIPWLITLAILLYLQPGTLKQKRIHSSIIGLAVCIFFGYLLLLLPNQKIENRWKNTIFADTEYQSQIVNNDRRVSIQSPLSNVFSNKVVVILSFLSTRFVQAYSPEHLFLYGEPAESAFSAWGHGWFYLIDAVLLLIGTCYVIFKKDLRVTGFIIAGFIILATFPALINAGPPWFLLRMFFPNVLLILFISWGVFALATHFRWALYVCIPLYAVGVITFTYHYYYRYPVLGLNLSYFSERIMSEYIERASNAHPDKKIIVYTVDPPVMFWTYLVYTDSITTQNVGQIAQTGESDVYTIGNVTFTGKCVDIANKDSLLIAEANRTGVACEFEHSSVKNISEEQYKITIEEQRGNAVTIPSVIDNGAYWRVYNPVLCDRRKISGFVTLNSFSKLNTSAQNNDKFCANWFTNVE